MVLSDSSVGWRWPRLFEVVPMVGGRPLQQALGTVNVEEMLMPFALMKAF